MEERVKFTLMVRGRSDYRVDGYTERKGADEARGKTISIDESMDPPTTTRLQRPGWAAGCPAVGRRASAGPDEGASAASAPLIPPLLHRHRLGQVPRLVHVGAARERHVVGEQLHRDGVHDRAEHADVTWGADDVDAFGLAEVAVGVGEQEQHAAAGAEFLHVGLHLFQDRKSKRLNSSP